MSGRRNSYEIAIEEDMAPLYSIINGIPSAINGRYVVTNGTCNVSFIAMDQVDSHDQVSLRSSETDASNRAVKKAELRRKSIVSVSDVKLTSTKLLFTFGICIIIGLFLLPVVFYYFQLNASSDSFPDTSDNFSMVLDTCNISSLNNGTLVLNTTYESLRAVSQETSSYCITKLNEILTDKEVCSQIDNFSHTKDVMCQQVRQEYCNAEWRLLEMAEISGLINCSEYEEIGPLNCSDPFDLPENGSICLPVCRKISQFNESFTVVYYVLTIVSQAINLIGGIAVLAISFWKRKKMFLFPQILIVINASIMTFVPLIILIVAVSLHTWNLLCPSKYLQPSSNPTFFCQLQGFSFSSAVILFISFWFLYIVHLTLRLFYPVKSGKIDKSEHSRTIHIIEILVVLFIGTVPYIVIAGFSKYQITQFPPLYCGTNAIYNFYGTVLPTLMIGCASVILLLFSLYKIHIHQGIFKRRQKISIGKHVRACQFTTPEVKILFALCYLLTVMVILWTTFSIRYGTSDTFAEYFKRYVGCMSTGNSKNPDCKMYKRKLEDLSYPVLDVIYLVLIAFLNFSSFPFLVQYKTAKHMVRRATRRLSSKSLTDPNKS